MALDLTMDATRPYTGAYFYEEMRGLADAASINLKTIERIHMIGELTKGACSMFGAWGDAVAHTDTRLLQLRALDWDVDGPFKDYPQLTVYHPLNASYGYAFVNVGFTGWVGSITGVSANRMAVSEIGVSFPDNTFGADSRFGTPFTFLLRDVLQFDATLEDALNRMANAHRTCSLIFGVGDGKQPAFRGIQYSHSVVRFFNDLNMQPLYDWHPRMKNIVYYGMDWLCPGFSKVLHAQLQKHYGNISAETAIRDITAITQTGDLQCCYYDLTNGLLYSAHARSRTETGARLAYDRPFIRLNLTTLFAEAPPARRQ